MSNLHDHRFPNETDEYRKARNSLLTEEIALRRQVEKVAAARRALPVGGELRENYRFTENYLDTAGQLQERQIEFADLFNPQHDNLLVYSFMYGPEMDTPCPSCSSILDSLNGAVPHISQRTSLVVVAKSPMQRIRNWAIQRGWDKLRLLSSAGSSYNSDYLAEGSAGNQLPALNVFQKKASGIFHFYNTEMLYTPWDEGQGPRHVDALWPLWSALDLLPEGRGSDWHPALRYD